MADRSVVKLVGSATRLGTNLSESPDVCPGACPEACPEACPGAQGKGAEGSCIFLNRSKDDVHLMLIGIILP